jgi:hypothetical protein
MRVTTEDNVGTINIFTHLKRGRYFTQNFARIGGFASRGMTANQIYAMPFYLGSRTLIDRLAINVVTAVGSSNARMGIYASLLDKTLPGALLVDKEVATATTGIKQDTTVSVSLSGNRIYWLALLCSAAITVKTTRTPSWIMGVHRVENATTPEIIQYLYASQTYGALPSPFPALANLSFGSASTDGDEGPAIWFRTAP